MAEYIKTDWVDEEEPAIDAANLNKIEQGIYDANKNIQDLADVISLGGLI